MADQKEEKEMSATGGVITLDAVFCATYESAITVLLPFLDCADTLRFRALGTRFKAVADAVDSHWISILKQEFGHVYIDFKGAEMFVEELRSGERTSYQTRSLGDMNVELEAPLALVVASGAKLTGVNRILYARTVRGMFEQLCFVCQGDIRHAQLIFLKTLFSDEKLTHPMTCTVLPANNYFVRLTDASVLKMKPILTLSLDPYYHIAQTDSHAGANGACFQCAGPELNQHLQGLLVSDNHSHQPYRPQLALPLRDVETDRVNRNQLRVSALEFEATREGHRVAHIAYPVHDGSCIATPGFGLRTDKLVHAVGPTYHFYHNSEIRAEERMAQMYARIYKLCDNHAVEGVAIPSIATGGKGFPADIATEIAFQCLIRKLRRMVAERSDSRWDGRERDPYAFAVCQESDDKEGAADAGAAACARDSTNRSGDFERKKRSQRRRRPSERSPLKRIAFILFENSIHQLYELTRSSILSAKPFSDTGSPLVTRVGEPLGRSKNVVRALMREAIERQREEEREVATAAVRASYGTSAAVAATVTEGEEASERAEVAPSPSTSAGGSTSNYHK